MSIPPSPSRALMALTPTPPVYGDNTEWQAILHSSNQVVLYNPRSHALSISHSADFPILCPYCKQTLPSGFDPGNLNTHGQLSAREERSNSEEEPEEQIESLSTDPAYHSRVSDYFQLLEIANDATSRPSTPPLVGGKSSATSRYQGSRSRSPSHTRGSSRAFPANAMAEGYFNSFFQEEYKLGMGANGSVFLCQHMLDGNPLGHFAVKKIAVGESHSYLFKILREVRLLESLHHPNIITYHHAWLETCQFSSFGPKVPTLHVLMQWAEGGSLDDFIDIRLGRQAQHIHIHPHAPSLSPSFDTETDQSSASTQTSFLSNHQQLHRTSQHHRPNPTPTQSLNPSQDTHSRSARIRAFRAFQRAMPEEKERMRAEMDAIGFNASGGASKGTGNGSGAWRAVHLLSADEVRSLFRDVVEGLAFLHDKSILHLDLKPGNVLLTWDEGKLIPRAMLSDFGTSRDMITSRAPRSGNTGTLEYASPESLPSPRTGLLQQIDSKADMWSLGMILHKILFFKLPYRFAADGDADAEAGAGISKQREGDKLQALEREVLEYPGFKSTPALLTSFEARRLPRAFLVLLESLLNKIPAGRPSVERVSAAIRDGKLDPLQEPSRPEISSLVPVSRIKPTESNSLDTANEKSRLLGPPSPTNSDSLPVEIERGWIKTLWQTLYERRKLWIRAGKSCLLVYKVFTLPTICMNDMNTKPRSGLTAFLLAAAIVDAAWEPVSERSSLFLTVGFAILHLGAIKIGQTGMFGGWSCVS